jgi:AraC-like DNA-binding protein
MDAGAADQGLQFSTDSVPARDRLPYFREALGRSIMRLDLGPYDDSRPLRFAATVREFDGLSVMSQQTNGHICRRTRSLLTDGHDEFIFSTNLSGFSLPSQVGREFRMDAGPAVLLSGSDVGARDLPVPGESLTLRIARRLLNGMAAKPEDALARPIPANTEALRLLVDYVRLSLKNRQPASPELRRLFATHISDLVALAVGATRDGANTAYGRGMRAARLSAIKSDIIGGLDDEGLGIGNIAKRRGVTPRYVQMLFESEGSTFTEFVLERRLTRAYRMLVSSRHDNRTIAAIAFEVGFGNLSYFNRAFRKRFGMTPSDARRADRNSPRA